jgi:hypothetical protein
MSRYLSAFKPPLSLSDSDSKNVLMRKVDTPFPCLLSGLAGEDPIRQVQKSFSVDNEQLVTAII